MKISGQLLLLMSICMISTIIEAILPFSFSASVIAMVILWALLQVNVIKSTSLGEVVTFFRTEMALFFVPICVTIIDRLEMIRQNGILLLFICFFATIFTFFVSGYTVVLIIRMRQGFKK